jgi:hypothetical protein
MLMIVVEESAVESLLPGEKLLVTVLPSRESFKLISATIASAQYEFVRMEYRKHQRNSFPAEVRTVRIPDKKNGTKEVLWIVLGVQGRPGRALPSWKTLITEHIVVIKRRKQKRPAAKNVATSQ